LVGESDKQKLAAVLRHDEDAERYANAAMKHLAAQHGDVDPNLIYIVASVDQGDDLYADAKQAGIAINCCFNGGLVMAPTPTTGYAAIDVGDLEILVLGPDAARIDALRKLWAKETKGRSVETIYADSPRIASVVAADTDASVTNLSSIVFLAELDGHSILMPGDARGDYIIEGLDRAGRLSGGSAHVDVLKLQHHGSARNVDERFFATVTANDYVISANGEYGNPDLAIFDALVDARGEQGYRVWMTNGAPGSALAPTVAAVRAEYPKLALNVRPAADPSLRINVAD